jgi:hypothetical protein
MVDPSRKALKNCELSDLQDQQPIPMNRLPMDQGQQPVQLDRQFDD